MAIESVTSSHEFYELVLARMRRGLQLWGFAFLHFRAVSAEASNLCFLVSSQFLGTALDQLGYAMLAIAFGNIM